MNYVVYDDAGNILQFMQVPELLTESPIPDTHIKAIADTFQQTVVTTHRIVNDELVIAPATELMADTNEIKSKWLQLEKEPIQVGDYIVDCDPVSELRMDDAIAYWDLLPIIPGQFEDVNGIRKITWSMDNGKVQLSKVELQQVYDFMVSARAVRAATLFNNYQRIKSLPEVPLTYILDKTNWFK